MGVHGTVYILNITMMIKQEKGKEVVKKYIRKGRVLSGRVGRVTYIIRIMFMNHRVKKIVKTKFIHIKHIFLQI